MDLIGRGLTKLLGLTVGFGIKVNLAEAYTYLMQVYEPGDRVFVFGFSRGTYTARALAGMSHPGGTDKTRSGEPRQLPGVGLYQGQLLAEG